MVFAFCERVKGMAREEVYVIYRDGKPCESPCEGVNFRAAFERPGAANGTITKIVGVMTDNELEKRYKDKEEEWYYAPRSLREEIESEFRKDFEVVPYGPKK